MAFAPSMSMRSRSVRPPVGAARRGAARRGRRAGVRAAAEKPEDAPGGAGDGAGGAGDGVGGGAGGEGPAPAPAEQLAEAAAGGSWLEGVVNETKLIDWPSRGEVRRARRRRGRAVPRRK